MCSLSYFRLENWLRVHLLSCLSLLDEATKGANTAFNLLLFFHIKSTPGSVLLCSFCVSALSCQTPSQSCQTAAHTEPGSGSAGGFFLLKRVFLSTVTTCMLCTDRVFKRITKMLLFFLTV
ncbi:hypothetical protein ATANTOWER_010497 [Ataeniobius toweri]|uniref:Secreted protein n=1 Tax=Ataeniobius toweri TaxID=208326 RepID=A0ABU7AXU0_9TELE|nr:hypothetical protein [Ataeniobius toweri]